MYDDVVLLVRLAAAAAAAALDSYKRCAHSCVTIVLAAAGRLACAASDAEALGVASYDADAVAYANVESDSESDSLQLLQIDQLILKIIRNYHHQLQSKEE